VKKVNTHINIIDILINANEQSARKVGDRKSTALSNSLRRVGNEPKPSSQGVRSTSGTTGGGDCGLAGAASSVSA
jgi:hypothetical protein